MSPPVLRLGDPRLGRVAAPVDLADPTWREELALLHATLAEFRATHGFGRAIAAPQLGFSRRMIALNLGHGPFAMLNPEILRRSADTFTLWDDCLCFPELLVRVRRACSIDLRYFDEQGRVHVLRDLDRARSELYQHELDHLDGILATERAEGDPSRISRDDMAKEPGRYAALVDYLIGP